VTDAQIVATHNGYGWTSTIPNQITVALLDWLATLEQHAPLVLDVGAGLGVGTLPLLDAGARVIALDLDDSHLALIAREAGRRSVAARLPTVADRFPSSLQFENLDAIHCSNVFHFLSGSEIEAGAAEMHQWLIPGGKVFLQVGTVFGGHVKRFLPIFESRRRSGVKWAGETHSAKKYVAADYQNAIPSFYNHLDEAPLVEAFRSSGFQVERSWYYTRTGLPGSLRNDGREHFGLIATRPRKASAVHGIENGQ